MRMTIKEILEKCEKKDKVSFKGIVKAVYDGAESKTKYTNFKQNVVIKDDTDEIRVCYNYVEKEEECPKDIVGKEIEIVNGVFSEYVNQKGINQKNIFGKLIFKEGEEPIRRKAEPNVTEDKKTSMPLIVEVRKTSLKLAMDFWTARIGDKMEEDRIIRTADRFYLYLTGKANMAKVETKVEKIEKEEEEEKAEIEEEGEEIKKEEEISAANVILINEVMALKESQRIDEEVFKGYLGGRNIKALTIEELKTIKRILNAQTEDIPF